MNLDEWSFTHRLNFSRCSIRNTVAYYGLNPRGDCCNICTSFKYDIRCASLCGVEFVVTKERREKRAQRESYLKGVRRL